MILNLDGHNFVGQPSSCAGRASEHLQWNPSCSTLNVGTVHVDACMWKNPLPGPAPHYAWLLESPATTGEYERLVEQGAHKRFAKVFTHSTRLVQIVPNAAWVPASGVWVQDMQMHHKTKMCSMITSPKAFLPGHQRRLLWADRLKDKVDVFGLVSRIPRKEEGLCPYRFSVAIENAVAPGYFTEKILDCFATGTIPVYLGAPDIGVFFNPAGILQLESIRDWARLTPELYERMLPAVQDNFDRVQRFKVPEDQLVRYIL